MKRRNATRSALFTSIISLLLCVSMLVGTTFAWFTDEVKSGNNVIASGNLDVELYHSDLGGEGYVDGNTTLFDDVTLWEPGAVVYENLTVQNKGSLALKYQLALNFSEATETAPGSGKTLADVLKVAVVPGGFSGDREAAKALDYNYDLETFALTGSLLAGTTASEVYGIVIYWEPGANDNDYNVAGGLSIKLGVELFATQVEAESDSFNNKYDVDAWEDTKTERTEVSSSAAYINADGSATLEVNAAPATATNLTTIEAPAGAFETTDKVEVEVETTNSLFAVDADGAVVASLDVTMTVNGEETSADLADGKFFTVTTYISKGLTNVTVAYTGTDGKAQPTNVNYDAATGKLTFQTNHFSNYAVSGTALAYDEANDTALTTIQQVVNATQKESNTVVIPEANKVAIEGAINQLPAEEKQAATNATAAAKIGDETYATLTEAFAKAEDNATIVVLNNVAVNTAITIPAGKNVVVNLNGNTISGILSGTGNQDLFMVKGNLTMKNGSVELTATQNQGWGAMSAIFDITAGGVVNLENVVADNKGGTDMNFVAHLNNWGEASLNVNDSTLKATYVAVRVFNSGYDMNNVSIKNSTLSTTGNAAFWVHNYTAADFGTQDKADAQAKLLNFTFENVKFEAKKAAFRYGMTNAEYRTADGAQLVSTADELVAALAAGQDVVLTDDVEMESATTAPYGNKYAVKLDGGVLDGNGKELHMECYGDDYGIMTIGGTIKNITIQEGCRAVMIMYPQYDIILDNVNIGGDGVLYPINTGEGGAEGVDLIVTNSTLAGWTSYGLIESASFTNVKFEQGTYYGDSIYGRVLKPYVNTTLTNCSFVEHMNLDLSALTNGHKITIENCTVNGQAVTADVFTIPTTDAQYNTELFTVDLPSWATSISDCVVFN